MKKKQHIQTQTEWEEEMSCKILQFVHDELYIDFRFLEITLSALEPKWDKRMTTLATDGSMLFFSAEQLMRVFRNNPKYLNRVYLHTVMHCIFSHLWIAGKREAFRWGIACDIAVEYTIDHMEKDSTKRIIGWLRQKTYEELEAWQKNMSLSAAGIYQWLSQKSVEEIQALHQEFFADDHVFWPKEEEKQAQAIQAQQKWSRIARQTQLEQKRRGKEEGEGEELISVQMNAQKSRRSYRDFLKKFALWQEEMHSDPDEFDLGFYLYGLQHYGNMPLLEPQESREVKKIREFVVVLDTSYSTSGKLIESFLRETFDLLCQEDILAKGKLHIIQCDEKVQSDICIENKQQLEQLFQNFTVQGGGNTDFRPAFAYVNQLLEEKKLTQLCGLLYFTDGKGIYPKKKPSYKTAFLFLEDFEEDKVPPWAIRMKLDKTEFEE
ncbi:MAG: VWA-like domain-containing protein [bacterium]|nr:VWA-like domain-containing protein [bacterium]